MDRREELVEYIKIYRDTRKQNIRTFLTENILEIIPSFQEKINFLINEQIKKQRNVEIKFIFLCQTLSSGYTGSNEVILGMSSNMLYLDEDRSQVFWYPELFYRYVNTDLADVEKVMRKNFQRLEEYELLHIKRQLLNDIWDLIPEFFCAMVKQSGNLVTNSSLCLEDEVFFLCGKYMDSLKSCMYYWRRKIMGRKQSSFHMGNEFNGNGEVRYLKGTQPCIHPPVSQENVQLTPDFGNYLLKVLGSIPVAISPLNINPVLFALLGSMFSVTQVIITKDPVTGNYDVKFKIISPHDFTNGSYPYTFQIMDNQVPAAMGVKNQWVAFGEQWKYLKNGKYLWHCWEMIDGKWYYFHSDEIMASHEWIETNGKWYFVHGDGDMAVNAWIETNDIWYYVGKDGVMYSDVVATIDGERYYFYKTGRLAVLEVIYIPNTGEKYEADGKGVLTPIENHESLEGTYVDVPQNGKLGTVVSYMGYHKIQSKSSDQYKLKKDAEDTGRYSIASPEYYAMIDSRIVIATKKTIGGKLRVSVADYVDVDFKKDDGSICTYECIIGDIKGDDAPNSWGHYDGQGVVEVIYHDYNPPAGYNKNINNPWGKGRVIRITIAGNYYD